jgi:excisionase family DNA binding protein
MVARNGRKVRIFSALEVANICGVVNQTAINWIKNGYLKAFTTPGGQYRIYAKDLAAFLDKRGMGDSGEALQVIMEKAKWNTILVASADEDLNSEAKNEIQKLLPDYEVLQAFDGFEIGRLLTGGKPGFLILDRNLPGVDIPRLVKTVKEDIAFGKPFVLIMSTDSGKVERADKIFPCPPEWNQIVETIKGLEKNIELAVSA